MYSESVLGLARVGFVDVSDALAPVVLSGNSVVDTLESEDGLVDILLNF